MRNSTLKRIACVFLVVLLLPAMAACSESANWRPVPFSQLSAEISSLFGGGGGDAGQGDPITIESTPTPAPIELEPDAPLMTRAQLEAIATPTAVKATEVEAEIWQEFNQLAFKGFTDEALRYAPIVSEQKYTYFIGQPGVVHRYETGSSPEGASVFLTNEDLLYLVSAHTVEDTYAQGDLYRLVVAMRNREDDSLMEAISYNYQMVNPAPQQNEFVYDSSADPRWASPEGVQDILMMEGFSVWLSAVRGAKTSLVRFSNKAQTYGTLRPEDYDSIALHPGSVAPLLEVIKGGVSSFYMLPDKSTSATAMDTQVPPPEGVQGTMMKSGDFMLFIASSPSPALYITNQRMTRTTLPSEFSAFTWKKLYDGAVSDAFLLGETVCVTLPVSGGSSVALLDYAGEAQQPRALLGLENINGKVFGYGNAVYYWAEDGTLTRHMVINTNIHFAQTIGKFSGGPQNGELFFAKDYVFAYGIAKQVAAVPGSFRGYLPLSVTASTGAGDAAVTSEQVPSDSGIEPASPTDAATQTDASTASNAAQPQQNTDANSGTTTGGDEDVDAPVVG